MNNLASRTALAVFAVFTAAGCVVPGERASTGLCPAGEVCSDEAPQGLLFEGASTADSFGPSVGITAKGGVQTIKALLNDTSDTTSSNDSLPFDKKFDAKMSDIKVASVLDVAPPTVDVHGETDGTSFLRLLEPGTSKLLDRVSLQVESIDKVTLYPADLFLIMPDDSPWTMIAGSDAPLIVRLKAANGERLIDQSLSMTSTTATSPKLAWDLFQVKAPGVGESDFVIEAGGKSFTATAPAASAIDAIVPSTFVNNLNADDKLEVMSQQLYCFVAQAGGVSASGASWSFSSSKNLELSPPNPGDLTKTLRSCIQLNGTEVGPATLTVTANEISKTFDLQLVKKSSRRPREAKGLASIHPRRAPSAGERAALEANN